jgi:hypothetical protein
MGPHAMPAGHSSRRLSVRLAMGLALCLAAGGPAAGEPPDPDTLTSLDVHAARFLAVEYRHVRLPQLRTLTAEAAGPLASTPWTIDLPAVDTVDIGVARALVQAGRCYELRLDGLERLPIDVAAILARHEGELSLAGLRSIPPGLAAVFAKAGRHLTRLALPLPPDTPVESLRSLAAAGHNLEFTGPVTLTTDRADAFAGFAKYLTLSGTVAPLTPAVAERLTFPGVLHIPGAIVLDDAVAEILARRSGGLWITGLTRITPGVAESLHRRSESIALRRPLDLDPATAAILARSRAPSLDLSGLTAISPAAARAVATHPGSVFLTGLTTLAPDVAAALADHGSWLSLGGLTALEPDAAAALARHRGDIALRGLTSLSPSTAAALEPHAGELSLAGITSLDGRDAVAVAEALARKRGTLQLPSLRRISAAALMALVQKPEDEIPSLEALDVVAGPGQDSADDLVLPEWYLERPRQPARRP